MKNDRGWKKGNILISKPDAEFLYQIRLKYLADSQLDYECFIAEDENGDIEDDWIIEEFDKE